MKSLSGFVRTQILKRRLERTPVVVQQRVEGVEIAFVVTNWVEYHNRARDSYTGEPETVAWIKNNLCKGDVLWDVGANVGAYTLLAAKLVPEAAVVAFEPYIATFSHLWENIALNRCSGQVTPLCVALSRSSAIDNLGVSDPRAGSSEHRLGDKRLKLQQPTLALRGDDAIKYLGLKQPNLMKIDVDGYEAEILKGMRRILRSGCLRLLLVEVHRDETEFEVKKLLTAVGFEMMRALNDEELPVVRNRIFIKLNRRLRASRETHRSGGKQVGRQ